MFFNHDKASLRLNVLLGARRLVGAMMKNPALDGAPELCTVPNPAPPADGYLHVSLL